MRENYKEFFSSMMFILLLITTNVFAQQQQWAQRAGGNTDDYGNSIATDGSGNVYVTGSFDGSITFGGTTLTSAGSWEIFIVKYNSDGVVQWAQRAGSAGYDVGRGIAVDGSGNVYVTGGFSTTSATFGGTTLTSPADGGIFVAKYNSSGVVQWAQRAGGMGWDEGLGIAVDGSGNVYVTGFIEGSVTFGTITLLNSSNDRDIFVAKYNSNGVVQWAERAGGTTAGEAGRGIAVDGSGNVYVTGHFEGSTTFGTITLTSAGDRDIFIAQYNSTGIVQWAQRAGAGGDDYSRGIAVDGSGNACITGYFRDNATFGTITLTGSHDEIFIVKYNSTGIVQWAQRAGGTGTDYGNSIALDVSGNVYVTGGFSTTSATFGGTTLTSTGSYDIFVVKYKSNDGVVQWAERAGGSIIDEGFGIAVDGSGNVYATGRFFGSATFGGTTLTSAGGSDIFVVKYAVATITSLSPTATTATASAFPLTINGSSFQGTTMLTISVLDSQGMPTGTLNLLPFITSSSATQIVVNLPAGVAATVGTLTVTLSALSGTTTAVFLVQGDNIIVTNNANDGGGSLRRAFQLTSTGGTILIQGHIGAVQLTGGPIGVPRQVTLVDTNGGLEINGNGNSIFDVQCGSNLYLENVILTGSGNNPAIRNDCGTVVLRRSRVTGN